MLVWFFYKLKAEILTIKRMYKISSFQALLSWPFIGRESIAAVFDILSHQDNRVYDSLYINTELNPCGFFSKFAKKKGCVTINNCYIDSLSGYDDIHIEINPDNVVVFNNCYIKRFFARLVADGRGVGGKYIFNNCRFHESFADSNTRYRRKLDLESRFVQFNNCIFDNVELTKHTIKSFRYNNFEYRNFKAPCNEITGYIVSIHPQKSGNKVSSRFDSCKLNFTGNGITLYNSYESAVASITRANKHLSDFHVYSASIPVYETRNYVLPVNSDIIRCRHVYILEEVTAGNLEYHTGELNE